MWWVMGGVAVLAMATVAQAAPWRGFSTLQSAPGQGVVLTGRIASRGADLRGRIVGCDGDEPCPLAGARLTLRATTHDPSMREEVDALHGTVTLADGTACTFAGDVWGVRARDRQVARGALHGQISCPTLGLATISLYVKGYRQPLGAL